MTMRSIQLQSVNEPLIVRVRDRIVSAFQPMAVYLFGSAARGEAGEGSDLDLLVIMDLPKQVEPHEMAGRIRRLFDGWLVPFDILVETPEAFARNKRLHGHIANKVVSVCLGTQCMNSEEL